MDILLTIAKVCLVAIAISGVLQPLITERKNYGFVWNVMRRYTIGLFFRALGTLFLTVFVGVVLYTSVPFLKYGWLNAFYESGGNVLIRPIQEGAVSDSVLYRVLAILFFVVLLFVVPFLAKFEEEIFRKGYITWPTIGMQSVKFGLIHCIVGVPLAFGLALSITGLFYGWIYQRVFFQVAPVRGIETAFDEALMASTVAHSMSNTIVITFMIGCMLVLYFR